MAMKNASKFLRVLPSFATASKIPRKGSVFRYQQDVWLVLVQNIILLIINHELLFYIFTFLLVFDGKNSLLIEYFSIWLSKQEISHVHFSIFTSLAMAFDMSFFKLLKTILYILLYSKLQLFYFLFLMVTEG